MSSPLLRFAWPKRVQTLPLSRFPRIFVCQPKFTAKWAQAQPAPVRVRNFTTTPLHPDASPTSPDSPDSPAGTSSASTTDPEMKPFSSLAGRIGPELLEACQKLGYDHMTPVQEQVLALPDLSQDCLVQAKTGTGKTVAFLLPTLQSFLNIEDFPAGKVAILIIAPTRELATQIGDECNKLTALCRPPVECHLAYGGSNKKSSLDRFLTGKPSVLVATPGRLMDYLSDERVREKFTHMRSLVLDEADRLLDPGFIDDMKKILKLVPSKEKVGWQGLCFSATMPPAVKSMLHHVLKPGCSQISTISETEAPTVDRIPQSMITADVDSVIPTLHTLLACEQLDNPNLKAVIFAPTARYAGLLYQIFAERGVSPGGLPVLQMHSRMSQPARNKSVDAFKPAESGLLFASDVVGRGMDFPDVDLVVQVSMPMDKEQYVHRVGRTGRAGKGGRAVMILMPEEVGFVKKNPQFPIKAADHIHDKATTISSAAVVQRALANLPELSKEQAYVAFLGYFKGTGKITNMQPADVVNLANRFSKALGFEEPPAIYANVIGKMGLRGVPGLRKKSRDAPVSSGTRGQARSRDEAFSRNEDSLASMPSSGRGGGRGRVQKHGEGNGPTSAYGQGDYSCEQGQASSHGRGGHSGGQTRAYRRLRGGSSGRQV